MNTISSISAAGMQKAQTALAKSAASIATGESQAKGREIEDIIDIKTAEQSFKANAKVFNISGDLHDALLAAVSEKDDI